MGNLGKYLILLGAVGMSGLCSIVDNANASIKTSSDDLYSESIYIEKSSAEVPQSLESNARLSGEERVAAAEERPIESMQDLDAAPAPKKVSKRRTR